jgi:hypothetical protein
VTGITFSNLIHPEFIECLIATRIFIPAMESSDYR